jgi:hypothetical protein
VEDPDLDSIGSVKPDKESYINLHPYPGLKKQICPTQPYPRKKEEKMAIEIIVSKSWAFWSLNSLSCKFQKNYVKYYGSFNIFFMCKFYNFVVIRNASLDPL